MVLQLCIAINTGARQAGSSEVEGTESCQRGGGGVSRPQKQSGVTATIPTASQLDVLLVKDACNNLDIWLLVFCRIQSALPWLWELTEVLMS